ncbi:MAG TPA: hypothetical protein VF597_03980, partial [Candidatus Saccharimonadales bacterium]
MLTSIGALFYIRTILSPEYRGDILPYTMALVAEFFIITSGLLSFWTILSGRFNPRNFEYHHAQTKLYNADVGKSAVKILYENDIEETRNVPMYIHHEKIKVDVYIPVYGEPVAEIRETAIAARD